MKTRLLALIALVALQGCSGDSDEPSPEALENKEFAYRQACVARELVASGVDELQTLESVIANSDPDDPIGALNIRATAAAVEFARAYLNHAELRSGAYALVDSAVNHSASRADSAAYADRSNQYTIRAPNPETVENNVIADYQRDFATLFADEDHPCYWDLPF